MIYKYYKGSTTNAEKLPYKLFSHKYNPFMLSNPYENLTKYCFILSYYDGSMTNNNLNLL